VASRDDVLSSAEAGGKVIRGSALRVVAMAAAIVVGLAIATLLLHYLGVSESGRYVTVMSLVEIASAIADIGLNVSGSRELALRAPPDRQPLIANFLGQRMVITPVAVVLIVSFAVVAGYPTRMVTGTALAGTGLFIVTLADAVLLRLAVELRNAGLALVDFLRQTVALVGVALLVAAGATLTPFFAVGDRASCGPPDAEQQPKRNHRHHRDSGAAVSHAEACAQAGESGRPRTCLGCSHRAVQHGAYEEYEQGVAQRRVLEEELIAAQGDDRCGCEPQPSRPPAATHREE
jgi:hypothetical protein